MKIRLSPELSYIIGFWRKRRTKDGIGIYGEQTQLEIFSKGILDTGLTTPDKMLNDDDKIYFYHTAYRKFFQQIEKEQLDRYRYLNDYAASYLAGIFDSCGGIDEKGFVYLSKANKQDEMMLLRLGFGTKSKADRLVIERPVAFLTFIKNYVRIFKDHKVFGLIGKKGKK